MSLLDQAKQFREVFNQEMLKIFLDMALSKRTLGYANSLVNEEAVEFLQAARSVLMILKIKKARENLVKELSDLVFVCYQFAATYGIDLDKAMNLVFESNLSKLDEQGSQSIEKMARFLKDLIINKQIYLVVYPPQFFCYDTNGK